MSVGNRSVGKSVPRLRNVVGPPVEGAGFWGRAAELERFVELLDGGDNIALVAPRRVGKTSLMREVSNRLDEGYLCLHLDLEASRTPADFFGELARVGWEHLSGRDKLRSVFDTLIQGLGELRSEAVTMRVQEMFTTSWKQRGDRLFAGLAELDQRVVLFLDEVPIFVHRLLINESREIDAAGIGRADEFLQWLRAVALRHGDRLRIVVAGSIGLDPILHRAGLSATMNAYRNFELHPWDTATSREFLRTLAPGYGFSFENDADARLVEKLGACVPHHVQMFFGHVYDHLKRQGARGAFPRDIDQVYKERMLGSRGHRDLMHYEERLGLVIEPARLPLAIDLLTQASLGGLTPEAARRLAREHIAATNDVRAVADILGILQHDGYLRAGDDGRFRFESFYVRDWWHARHGLTFTPPAEEGP